MLRLGFLHHKTGTMFLTKVFNTLAVMSKHTYDIVPPDFQIGPELYERLGRGFVLYSNCDYLTQVVDAKLEDFRAFHIIRDPRDIIVSGYFSHRYSHKIDGEINSWLVPIRKKLEELPFNEGLATEIEHGHALSSISNWNFNDSQIIELRSEEVLFGTEAQCLQLLKDTLTHMQFDIFSDEVLLAVIRTHHEFFSGRRKRGEEERSSHFRKGTPGDWRNYFTERHVAQFKERWGDLCVRLGYEADNDWSLEPRQAKPLAERIEVEGTTYQEEEARALQLDRLTLSLLDKIP